MVVVLIANASDYEFGRPADFIYADILQAVPGLTGATSEKKFV